MTGATEPTARVAAYQRPQRARPVAEGEQVPSTEPPEPPEPQEPQEPQEQHATPAATSAAEEFLRRLRHDLAARAAASRAVLDDAPEA